MSAKNPLEASELFSHVEDATSFHVPRFLTPWAHGEHAGHIELPQPFATPLKHEGDEQHGGHAAYQVVWQPHTGIPVIDNTVKPLDFVFTKFMLLILVVAVGCVLLFTWLAKKIQGGERSKGLLANFLETLLVFIRDKIAEPAIGHHDAHRFLPYLWTVFFFVLGCNLIGMLPWMGAPTGAFAVTASLALCTFGAVLYAGIEKLGFIGFLKAQVPHMELPFALAIILKPLIFVIEIMGLLIKHFVLGVRLLANMVAGHLVLAVLTAFIGATAQLLVWYGVAPASVLGAVAFSLLELFVAFLQAYIFTFLSALFIGAAAHPH